MHHTNTNAMREAYKCSRWRALGGALSSQFGNNSRLFQLPRYTAFISSGQIAGEQWTDMKNWTKQVFPYIIYNNTTMTIVSITQELARPLHRGPAALASFPGLPCSFGSSVCVDNNTWMRKSSEGQGRPGIIHHMSDVRWTRGGCRGQGR